MQFGAKADVTASAAMFDAALAAGITHFDTAHLYAAGRSEEFLGRLAAPHRDRLVIATKVGYRDGTAPAQLRADFDLSRRRLGMETVDILYLHRFDREAPLAAQLGSTIVVDCDVADDSSIDALFDRLATEWGTIDRSEERR